MKCAGVEHLQVIPVISVTPKNQINLTVCHVIAVDHLPAHKLVYKVSIFGCTICSLFILKVPPPAPMLFNACAKVAQDVMSALLKNKNSWSVNLWVKKVVSNN